MCVCVRIYDESLKCEWNSRWQIEWWRDRGSKGACFTAMMIIMMATLHAPAISLLRYPHHSLKLPWNTLCVLSFSFVSVCMCFVCILRILRILLSCVFSHCLLLLSAHLLRTINENAHINISYFNTKPTHSNDSNNKSLAASCATASPTLPRHAHSRHFYFSLLEIFPPIKLTYAHSASHSFPTLLHPPLSPPPSLLVPASLSLSLSFRFYGLLSLCVCLHKFCNISGLCLQLANALKTQIYIFLCFQAVELFSVVTLSHCPSTSFSPLLLPSSKYSHYWIWICRHWRQLRGGLLFQMCP